MAYIGNNMGGIRKIEIIDILDVVSFPRVRDGVIDEMPIIDGAFTEVDFILESAVMTEIHDDIEGDDAYITEITGDIPKVDAVNMQALQPLPEKRYMIIATDFNGVRRVVGTPSNPARLIIQEDTSGQRRADRNQFTLMVTWASNNPAPIIVGIDEFEQDSDQLPYIKRAYFSSTGDLMVEYKDGKYPTYIDADLTNGDLIITASSPEDETKYSIDEFGDLIYA